MSSTVVELPPAEKMVSAATVRRLVALTRTELVCIASPARCPVEESLVALAELGRLSRRGIAVRMLCAPDTTQTPEGAEFVTRTVAHGIEARVSDLPLPELLMVDERVALVRPDLAPATVAYAPPILHTLRALFTGTWRAARPAVDTPPASARLSREILDCLNAGHKDDAAARRLGLSVRTYRRHVAEILREMGAASRFQAGARAAELRLLPVQPAAAPSTVR
jgi:DNA-binding CsgD family transcriptional regulator